jgi:hypothetical protein
MNLDELISKYLDGSLNDYEDKELRAAVAQDAASREEFDAAVNIHLALREDADTIFPPKDLVDSTEDLILMRILNLSPDEEDKKKPVVMGFIQPFAKYASVAAVMLVIFLYSIGEYNPSKFSKELNSEFDNKANNIIIENKSREIAQNTDKAEANEPILKNANGGESITTQKSNERYAHSSSIVESEYKLNSNRRADNAILPSRNTDGLLAEGKITTDNVIISQIQNDETAEPKVINLSEIQASMDKDNTEQMNASVENVIIEPSPIEPVQAEIVLAKSNYKENRSLSPNFNIKTNIDRLNEGFYTSYYQPFSNVTFTSFLGSDVFKNGLNSTENSLVTHFSQGIAYNFAESSSIGIEFGYSQYTFSNDNKPNSSSTPAIINTSGAHTEIIISTRPTASIARDGVNGNNKQIFWGAAFFEQNLLKFNNFDLNGRIGFGTTGDGPLGYSKMYVKYNIFSVVSLMMGAEGRLIYTSLPNQGADKNDFRSSISLIYGIQIKF